MTLSTLPLLLCWYGLVADNAQGDSAKDIIRFYLKGEDLIENETRNFTCEGDRTRVSEGGSRREHLVVARSNRSYVYSRETLDNDGGKAPSGSLVVCQAPGRWFMLTRADRKQPYVIQSMSDGTYRDDYQMWMNEYTGRFVDMFRLPGGMKLSELMNKSLVKIESIHRKRVSTHSEATIEFSVGDEKILDGMLKIDRINVICLPDFGWNVVELDTSGRAEGNVPYRLHRKLDYRLDDDRITPRQLVETTTYIVEGKTITSTDTFVFKKVSFGSATEGDFRLTSFGLPEIPSTPTRVTSFFSFRNPWLWAGLLVSVVAFAVQWMMKRRLDPLL